MKGKTQSLVVDIAEDYLIRILMYFLCSYFHEGMGPGAWLSPGHSRLHACIEIAKGYLKDRDDGWPRAYTGSKPVGRRWCEERSTLRARKECGFSTQLLFEVLTRTASPSWIGISKPLNTLVLGVSAWGS